MAKTEPQPSIGARTAPSSPQARSAPLLTPPGWPPRRPLPRRAGRADATLGDGAMSSLLPLSISMTCDREDTRTLGASMLEAPSRRNELGPLERGTRVTGHDGPSNRVLPERSPDLGHASAGADERQLEVLVVLVGKRPTGLVDRGVQLAGQLGPLERCLLGVLGRGLRAGRGRSVPNFENDGVGCGTRMGGAICRPSSFRPHPRQIGPAPPLVLPRTEGSPQHMWLKSRARLPPLVRRSVLTALADLAGLDFVAAAT